jgi:uncharacterized protein VirK/YbjX
VIVAPLIGPPAMTAGETTDPLFSMFGLARKRYYWSPARMLRILWGFSTNIPPHIAIFRLMRSRDYARFFKSNPRLPFRCLIRDYLANGLSNSERTACLLHHYMRLKSGMSAELLERILFQRVTVLETEEDDLHCEISLSFSRPFEKEGELSFNLHVDGAIVFVLSFSIVPGWVIKSDSKEVLLISRLQGMKDYYPQIRKATKALSDVAPAALLLAALDGFGRFLGIRRMASVSAARQSSYTEELSIFYKNAYDDFFSDIGLSCNTSGFFLSSLPIEEKPMTSIKRGHKLRTRKKRQFKSELADQVCVRLQQGLPSEAPEHCSEMESVQTVDI